jgi:hypothetical protein
MPGNAALHATLIVGHLVALEAAHPPPARLATGEAGAQ